MEVIVPLGSKLWKTPTEWESHGFPVVLTFIGKHWLGVHVYDYFNQSLGDTADFIKRFELFKYFGKFDIVKQRFEYLSDEDWNSIPGSCTIFTLYKCHILYVYGHSNKPVPEMVITSKNTIIGYYALTALLLHKLSCLNRPPQAQADYCLTEAQELEFRDKAFSYLRAEEYVSLEENPKPGQMIPHEAAYHYPVTTTLHKILEVVDP